ncbi:MAG: hypothetical protein COB46_05445 [Rhodospirillaceae bacterium]|nr:MAG: hypothetical protein COB46_05445 [Rhodospirillaceae bacterium]
MSKIMFSVIAAIFLAGCQTTGTTWQATNKVDEFTDKQTKMVTVGEWPSANYLVTQSLKYYPFVGIQNDMIFVGIRSGGRYRVPTGTVQLRIDSSPTWTISPEETPVALSSSYPILQIQTMPEFANLQSQIMENMTKMMSPYTAATGEKAKKIIKEMMKGKVIKYRVVGANQAASTTGEVALNVSFIKALLLIGITRSFLN